MNAEEITDQEYAAMGRVALAWSSFENALAVGIWKSSRMSASRGSRYTSELKWRQRFDLLLSLHHNPDVGKSKSAPKTQSPLFGTLQKISTRANAIAADRNRVIHSDWWKQDHDPNTLVNLYAKSKGKFDFGVDKMNCNDILAVAKRINKLTEEVWYAYIDNDLIKVK